MNILDLPNDILSIIFIEYVRLEKCFKLIDINDDINNMLKIL